MYMRHSCYDDSVGSYPITSHFCSVASISEESFDSSKFLECTYGMPMPITAVTFVISSSAHTAEDHADESRKVESIFYYLRFYVTCACRHILIVDSKIPAFFQPPSEPDHLECNFNTFSQTRMIYTKTLNLASLDVLLCKHSFSASTLFNCDSKQH